MVSSVVEVIRDVTEPLSVDKDLLGLVSIGNTTYAFDQGFPNF